MQKTIEIRVSQAAASTSPAEPQAAEWLTYYRDITQVERERGLQSRALTRMDAGRQAGRPRTHVLINKASHYSKIIAIAASRVELMKPLRIVTSNTLISSTILCQKARLKVSSVTADHMLLPVLVAVYRGCFRL